MPVFSTSCRLCPRLVRHLDRVRAAYPDYHALPVAPFGAGRPRLLVVGLAPGMRGANRTGRPFTGDDAGTLLYETLHRFGFANRAISTGTGDGLELRGCSITNAVKCLPPANKPTSPEVRRCNPIPAGRDSHAGGWRRDSCARPCRAWRSVDGAGDQALFLRLPARRASRAAPGVRALR
jgi:hypothetical protein